jgi:MYXO-CTERM domain-containing protein
VGAAPEAPLAAISLASGVPYTQDFNLLATSGAGSAVPEGWAFSESGTGANTVYTAGTGSSTTGDTYSFGVTGATDRALGGLQSGSVVPTIGVEFQNSSGTMMVGLAVSYICEQWRVGMTSRGAADRLDFQYSTDATSLTTGTWTDIDALDCHSATILDTSGAKNGNENAYRTAVSGNVSGLSITAGATFWLRWTDYNIANSDDGLAVDDFALTAQTPTAITLAALSAVSPGPAPAPLAGLIMLGGLAALIRRRTR